MAQVYIPTTMREFTCGQAMLQVPPGTVAKVLEQLGEQYPELQTRLYDSSGRLNSHIAVFVNEEDIRALENETTSVEDRDEVYIISAIAGG